MKIPFLYILHSGNLYGTERMALATLEALDDTYRPILFVPPGLAREEAMRLGIETHSFRNARELAIALRPWLARHARLAFAATGIMHSLLFIAWNTLYRRRVLHLHLVHGGTDEAQSYGRKRLLNGRPVQFLAVSAYVRDRLIANGVNPAQIRVCENFLPDRQIDSTPRREPFTTSDDVRRIIIVSRIDPIKRIDLLLDALDRHPWMGRLQFTLYGSGWDFETLRMRAAVSHPGVHFAGFSECVAEAMQQSDLLLHTCPVEPFGLALLEAMAARVPVIVPDAGGTAALVEPDVSGLHYRAGDPDALADALLKATNLSPQALNAMTHAACQRLRERYSGTAGSQAYRAILEEIQHA